jgi:LacI family transcriptional regulator
VTKENRRGPSGATIYDVASVAGVSPMTVSRVINGNACVADATRGRVMAALESLNYQVNTAARAARVGTMGIGLLFSNPSPAYLNTFLVGAMDRCSQIGAHLILGRCHDWRSRRAAIAGLVANGADGVLLPPPLCDSPSVVKQLDQMGIPTVAIATGRPLRRMPAVRIDDYAAAREMMRYLLAQGHRDIAFIQGDPRHTPAQLRYKAYAEAMKEAGLPVKPKRVAPGLFTYRSGLEAARQLLARRSKPTAIFAANDDMAAAAVAVAHGMRLDVPGQITICGFDDTPVATTVWPELTTIRQPIDDMARAAVDLMVELIRSRRAGDVRGVTHKLLPYTLVTRESSGCLG